MKLLVSLALCLFSLIFELNAQIKKPQIHYDQKDIDSLSANVFVYVLAQEANGFWKSTNLKGKRKLAWRKLRISVTGCKWDKMKKVIWLDMPMLLNHKNNQLYVEVSLRSKKDIRTHRLIKIPKPEYFYVTYPDTAILAPGFPIPLKTHILYDNGLTYPTNSKTRLRWSNFRVESPFWDEKAKAILVPRDTFDIFNYVDVHSKHLLSGLNHTLRIPILYQATYHLDFNGRQGWEGRIPPQASAGDGRGQDGIDGYTGENGGDGEDAGEVNVFVEAVPRVSDTILHIQVFSKYKADFINIASKGGLVHLWAQGGKGGKGGEGGKGEDGLVRDVENDLRGGYGGTGGKGGDGGNGGKGANLNIFVDSTTHQFLTLIKVHNQGGQGGKGGEGGKGGIGGGLFKRGGRGASGLNGKAGEDAPPPQVFIVDEQEMIRKRQEVMQKNE